MKSWARMKWRQHPATPVRPASSTTRLGTGNVTRVGTKSAPFTPGADPSRDGSGWPSRRKGSISMKSVTLFNPITRPAITTTTAKKYIDLFSFSVELGREEKSIQSGNGLMTRSNFESIFCWWLFYFSFHRLELTIFSAQWRRDLTFPLKCIDWEKLSLSIIGNTSYAQVIWTGRSIGSSESRIFFADERCYERWSTILIDLITHLHNIHTHGKSLEGSFDPEFIQ